MKSRAPFFVGITALLLVCPAPALAHVGSPDVFFEGTAGPYHLSVTVRLPLVVPGVAEIEIRSGSKDLRELRIVPLTLSGPGSRFAPTPDVAQRSRDDPQFFTGSLWLMERGSMQVRVLADGALGHGEVSVPVPSIAQRVLPMQRSLGVILFGLMLLLAVGAVSIAGAAAREGKLEPGATPTPAQARRARRVMAGWALLVVAVLYFGKRWWNLDKERFERRIYKPPEVAARLEPGGRLVLRPTDPEWVKRTAAGELIPDHDHLMHLFLHRLPGMDRFYHLHPEQMKDGPFSEEMPAVPAGRYQVFADVVRNNGFPVTMIAEVDLPDIPGTPLAGDDCDWSGAPISAGADATRVSSLADGGRMVWDQPTEPLKAGVGADFRFRVEDKDGTQAGDLEPYMGMPGHAEFVRADCSVFAHVHPAGSVSMAALALAEQGPQGDVAPSSSDASPSMAGMLMPAKPLSPEVSFPYGFPRPGAYRIFVQIKRDGRIETGVFNARVE